MEINIKVDTNDNDIIYIKSDIDENDIPDILLMVDAISNFKPYISNGFNNRHNFPNGGRYGFNMWRSDRGGESPYHYYVKGEIVSEKIFNTFKKYVKERTFHTIKQIKINKEIIFKIKN